MQAGVKVGVLCTVLGMGGCRHAPPPTGSSGFVFVEPPAPSAKAATGEARPSKTSEDYQEALPIQPLAKPVYPARALAAKAGRMTVGLRISVDAAGRVSDMGPSMVAFSTPGPFADDFMEAVQAAVGRWRFQPAEIQRIEMVEAPGLQPFGRIIGSEKVETHFDVSFTFTAGGKVLPGPAGK